MEVSRATIFQAAARKLRQDFAELSTVPHKGLKGDEAARLVRMFLNDHLPKRFMAGAGFIIDQRDQISKQTDVVIYDAMNCPVYRASEEAAIFPADNVAAVVEVKSRIDKEKFKEAAANINVAKSLAKTRPPDLPFLVQAQTLGCLFAFDSGISLETLENHYRESLAEHGLGRQIDLILVHDQAVITLAAKHPSMDHWAPSIFEAVGPEAEGSHLAIGRQELGELSLDGFLRFLLAQLTFFRGIMDHPGFKVTESGQMRLTYVTSFTSEKEPAKRAEKLRIYREQVEQDFARNPAPPEETP